MVLKVGRLLGGRQVAVVLAAVLLKVVVVVGVVAEMELLVQAATMS
jgi:hypothetical protein